MHRGILLAASALGAGLALASCGGGAETSQNAGGAAAGASPTPAAASAPTSSVQHGLPETPPGGGAWAGRQPDQNSATPSPPQPPPAHADDARRIPVDEAFALARQGRVVFVDVRGADAYQQGHIRGARLIPEAEIAGRVGELPKDKLIVTYCA